MKAFLVSGMIFLVGVMANAQSLDDINLTNVIDKKVLNIAKEITGKPTVVIFYSNKCAYSEYYIDRIKSLISEFSSQGINFLLVNANNGALVTEENEQGMVNYIASKSINIPYLSDKDKQLKNYLKATRTPEAFLLISKGGSITVVYKGAIDDSPQAVGDVNHQYLRNAIVSLQRNTSQQLSQTRPVGCLIR